MDVDEARLGSRRKNSARIVHHAITNTTLHPSQCADRQKPKPIPTTVQNPTDWNTSLKMNVNGMPMWLEYSSDRMLLRLARTDEMPWQGLYLSIGRRAACPIATDDMREKARSECLV
jgi:hypothetical protein